MIDFDALVLGPNMAAFARPIVVVPLRSQPGQLPYDAEGIYTDRASDVVLQDNQILSVQTRTLGIRLSDFVVPPKAGDKVQIPAHMSLPAIGLTEVDDTDDDGQGGAVLTLKLEEL